MPQTSAVTVLNEKGLGPDLFAKARIYNAEAQRDFKTLSYPKILVSLRLALLHFFAGQQCQNGLKPLVGKEPIVDIRCPLFRQATDLINGNFYLAIEVIRILVATNKLINPKDPP